LLRERRITTIGMPFPQETHKKKRFVPPSARLGNLIDAR
jgi:hypothetical protein